MSSNNTTYSTEKIDTFSEFKTTVFTATTFLYLVWFLGIYLIFYFLLSPNKEAMGATLNIILVVWLIYLCTYLYLNMTTDERENLWDTMMEWSHEYFNNDYEIFWLVLYTIIFYALIFFLKVPMEHETKPFMVKLLEDKFWILIIMFVIILFFKYALHIYLVDIFFELYYKSADKVKSAYSKYRSPHDISGGAPPPPPPPPRDLSGVRDISGRHCDASAGPIDPSNAEVFNISNNLYTYDDAQAICKSYGARLATYDDVEKSYNNGAEWCSYGWSANQMAYFPTQKSTWNALQADPKHKNDCGRPGVNGGYMENPNIKFGVNCYGVKPAPKQTDLDLMNARKQRVFPKSAADVALEQKVEYWKQNADTMVLINSFNGDTWSKY